MQRDNACRTEAVIAVPPWMCNSRTSSPVEVLGAGKKRTMAFESRILSWVGVVRGS
jgi:hypothetical protein